VSPGRSQHVRFARASAGKSRCSPPPPASHRRAAYRVPHHRIPKRAGSEFTLAHAHRRSGVPWSASTSKFRSSSTRQPFEVSPHIEVNRTALSNYRFSRPLPPGVPPVVFRRLQACPGSPAQSRQCYRPNLFQSPLRRRILHFSFPFFLTKPFPPSFVLWRIRPANLIPCFAINFESYSGLHAVSSSS